MTSMVPVQIVGIRLDPEPGLSAVILGERDALTRALPIMIRSTEARSVADSFTDTMQPRSCTSDLATTLMAAAGCRVEEVAVTELRDGVLFAEVFMESADGLQSFPARPSDGIALAVRVGAPIFVRRDVLEQAAVPIVHTSAGPLSDDEIDQIVSDARALRESTDADDSTAEHWTINEGEPDEDIGWGDED